MMACGFRDPRYTSAVAVLLIRRTEYRRVLRVVGQSEADLTTRSCFRFSRSDQTLSPVTAKNECASASVSMVDSVIILSMEFALLRQTDL